MYVYFFFVCCKHFHVDMPNVLICVFASLYLKVLFSTFFAVKIFYSYHELCVVGGEGGFRFSFGVFSCLQHDFSPTFLVAWKRHEVTCCDFSLICHTLTHVSSAGSQTAVGKSVARIQSEQQELHTCGKAGCCSLVNELVLYVGCCLRRGGGRSSVICCYYYCCCCNKAKLELKTRPLVSCCQHLKRMNAAVTVFK